jgi:DNA-binding SARP family transcriptional activator
LCQRALQADIETEYVRRLIVRRNLMPDPPPYSLPGWPWRWRIQVLGRFAFNAGSPAAPGGAAGSKAAGRPVDLLQALVALGAERVKLERLGDALWPHVDSDYALRSLNTTLHRLRKLLSDDTAVLLQTGELSLSRRHFWLDTWAFEQSADAALALCAAGQGAQQAEQLLRDTHQALAHYHGPLLADLTDAAWAIAPRERFRLRLQRLLTTVCETLGPALGVDVTVDLCRRALECEPLSEPICRRLMQVLNGAGRGAEAIEVYQRSRTLIRAELKAEPSAATQELYQSIRP